MRFKTAKVRCDLEIKKLSDESKDLWVILDRKLKWKVNVYRSPEGKVTYCMVYLGVTTYSDSSKTSEKTGAGAPIENIYSVFQAKVMAWKVAADGLFSR